MKNILFVLSSPRGWKSYSHQFASHIVDDLKARHPGAKVIVRDVAKEPLPHVDEAFATGRVLPPEKRSPAEAKALALSDALVDELELPPDQAGSGSRVQYSLGFAPDALHKANVSGGDGPHIAFGDASMDAPLQGDDWEGVPFVSYLRTAFAWGGFPGLREAVDPPRDLLASLCEGLQPL